MNSAVFVCALGEDNEAWGIGDRDGEVQCTKAMEGGICLPACLPWFLVKLSQAPVSKDTHMLPLSASDYQKLLAACDRETPEAKAKTKTKTGGGVHALCIC